MPGRGHRLSRARESRRRADAVSRSVVLGVSRGSRLGSVHRPWWDRGLWGAAFAWELRWFFWPRFRVLFFRCRSSHADAGVAAGGPGLDTGRGGSAGSRVRRRLSRLPETRAASLPPPARRRPRTTGLIKAARAGHARATSPEFSRLPAVTQPARPVFRTSMCHSSPWFQVVFSGQGSGMLRWARMVR